MARPPRDERDAAHRARMAQKKERRAGNTPTSTSRQLLSAWTQARGFVKKRAVLAIGLAVVGGALATYAVRTYRLPAVCYKSTSVLPLNTSIFAGILDKGRVLSARESFDLIQHGLNTELEKVKEKDVGILFDRNGQQIGSFRGLDNVIRSDKPVTTLPTHYSLTINGRRLDDIDASDRFTVGSDGVKIGKHTFKITEVVEFAVSGDISIARVPDGRVKYNLIGRDKRYTCD